MNQIARKNLLLICLLVPSSMFGMLGRLGQRFSTKVGQRYVNRVVSQRLMSTKQNDTTKISNKEKIKTTVINLMPFVSIAGATGSLYYTGKTIKIIAELE